jgi:hypothetical protein
MHTLCFHVLAICAITYCCCCCWQQGWQLANASVADSLCQQTMPAAPCSSSSRQSAYTRLTGCFISSLLMLLLLLLLLLMMMMMMQGMA